MNCKHIEVKGNTTKYFYCKVKEKSVDTYECRDCPLKITGLPKEFDILFGGFKK